MVGGTTIELPPGYWQWVEASFVAVSGQSNEWTIPLPDELVQAVGTSTQSREIAQGQARDE